MASSFAMLPTNSISLLVMVPVRLIDDMRNWTTSCGEGLHHIIVSIPSMGSGTTRMPSILATEESWAPRLDGISPDLGQTGGPMEQVLVQPPEILKYGMDWLGKEYTGGCIIALKKKPGAG
jgi:hypothetical protein